jgi:hypothetical protein
VSVLTFDTTGTPITVACQRGGHAPPRRVGTKPVSHAGIETSSVREELMVVPVVLIDYSPAIAASIRALFACGNQVSCSGDVFNNGGAAIVCSATFADEFEPAGPWFGLAMTLFEVGTGLGYGSPASVYLSNLADDDTGAFKKAWTTIEGGFANTGARRILNEVLLATCGSGVCTVSYTDPSTPEAEWLSTAFVSDGYLSGTPIVSILSIGGTADKFSTQNCMATIELLRAGVTIYSTTTAYGESNGGFAGATITLVGTESIIWQGLIADRIKIEIYGRCGLNGGYADGNNGTDDLNRQTITWGYNGAGDYHASLSMGGLARALNPA